MTGRDQRLEHAGVAGHVDRADTGAGRGERPHVLTAEPAECAGDDRHPAIEPEHFREDSISHLVIFQLFNWKLLALQAPGQTPGTLDEASGIGQSQRT